MSLDDIFDTPVVGEPFLRSGNLVEDGKLVYFPSTTRVHAGLLQRMVERGRSLVIVTPSDRANFLHLLALEALFGPKVEGRDSIFLLSSNTEFRERFRQLAPRSIKPPHDKSRYAREETPIANVTMDGSPATVTKNLKHPDKPARFFFAYSSTRLPSDEIGQRIRCVLYDDSVKYVDERFDELISWKNRNDVPSILFFTSDPTSDIIQRLKGHVFVWTWPPTLLTESVARDRLADSEWTVDADELSWTTERSLSIRKREQNRSAGLSIEVHTCGDGEVARALRRANERRAKYEYLARKLDSEVLHRGRAPIRYTLGNFRELLTPVDFADFHARRRTISGRIAGLERFQSQIASDPEASPAGGTYRDVVSALKELEDIWDDAPTRDKKQGEIVDKILYGALERGETISVVAATEGHRQALTAFLRSEHPQLYRDLGGDLEIHDGHSIRSAAAVDNVVLYGALRWKHRDLLRTDVATNAIVLAYPIEMGLLHSQVESLGGSFEEIAASGFWGVIDKLTVLATGDRADVEEIDIDIPDFEEASTSSLGEEISVEGGEAEDLGEIVRGYETDYESDDDVDPEEFQVETVTSYEKGSGREESDCVELHFDDGSAMILRRTDEVHTIRRGHDKLFKKRADRIEEGDVVIHLEHTDDMRETLYALIRERGDVGLYYYANMWKVSLEAALEETSDDLDDFIEKMTEQGLEKRRSTYRSWYNLEVHRTRSKQSFWAIAKAYDLEGVKENFNKVWNAVHEMETIYRRLKRALRQTALRSAAQETLDDEMLSESPDIRLSDFDIGKYLYRLEVASKTEGVTAKSSQIGFLRDM